MESFSVCGILLKLEKEATMEKPSGNVTQGVFGTIGQKDATFKQPLMYLGEKEFMSSLRRVNVGRTTN